MQPLADLWQAIPEPLHDPVALAVPFFLLFVGLEGLAAYLLEDERPADQRRAPDGRALPCAPARLSDPPGAPRQGVLQLRHGTDPEYLDRNYAGILIVWDRLFGSYQPELHRPTYGLTTPVRTHRIVRLRTHEYAASPATNAAHRACAAPAPARQTRTRLRATRLATGRLTRRVTHLVDGES